MTRRVATSTNETVDNHLACTRSWRSTHGSLSFAKFALAESPREAKSRVFFLYLVPHQTTKVALIVGKSVRPTQFALSLPSDSSMERCVAFASPSRC